MSRSELVFAVFFQIKRSILPSQGQTIFLSDPWLTPHARKVWKSSKPRPLPNLSVVVLTTRQNASTDQEITKAAFQKTKFKSNRNSPGGPIIETAQHKISKIKSAISQSLVV